MFLRDALKGIFVQNLGSFVLSLSYLELGELDEELLVEGSLAKLSERSLEVKPGFVVAALVLFKVCRLNIAGWQRICIDEAFQNTSALLNLTLSLLKLQEGVPGILSWLPGHPVFKDSSSALHLTQHLLHQRILVPKLVNTWHVLAGPFPDITRRVDKLVAHLHLSVLEPEGHMLKVHCYCALEDRSCPDKFTYASFPLCIFQPRAHMVFLHSQRVFKVLPHAIFVVIELIRVGNSHACWAVLVQLVLNRFTDKLL